MTIPFGGYCRSTSDFYSGVMSAPNHDTVLGVFPDAVDDVALTGAPTAPAQHYHPNKGTGDPDYSQPRISKLNEVCRVLGACAKREEHGLRARNPSAILHQFSSLLGWLSAAQLGPSGLRM